MTAKEMQAEFALLATVQEIRAACDKSSMRLEVSLLDLLKPTIEANSRRKAEYGSAFSNFMPP